MVVMCADECGVVGEDGLEAGCTSVVDKGDHRVRVPDLSHECLCVYDLPFPVVGLVRWVRVGERGLVSEDVEDVVDASMGCVAICDVGDVEGWFGLNCQGYEVIQVWVQC